jgi:hypothetical protein
MFRTGVYFVTLSWYFPCLFLCICIYLLCNKTHIHSQVCMLHVFMVWLYCCRSYKIYLGVDIHCENWCVKYKTWNVFGWLKLMGCKWMTVGDMIHEYFALDLFYNRFQYLNKLCSLSCSSQCLWYKYFGCRQLLNYNHAKYLPWTKPTFCGIP